jgi:hypothetical protein
MTQIVCMMTDNYVSKIEQFHYEHTSWLRLLDFFKQENAFLKTRLAEVLDNNADKEFLAYAEHFQNQFIIKDEFIDELKHDINHMIHFFENRPVGSKKDMDKKMETRQTKLRNEMEYFEKDFVNLKNEFNKYVVSVL